MRRFSRRISGVNLRSGVPLRNASMPPLNSMVRIALVERRSRIAPILSDNSETVCRFGRNRRLVLRFEWLTLLPTWTPLPVIGHLRAMPHLASARKIIDAITQAIAGGRFLCRPRRAVKDHGAASVSGSARRLALVESSG